MENIKTVIAICGAALPLVASTITFLVKLIKNNKAKSFLQNTLKLTEELQPLIIEAEQFLNYTGKEKKEYVLVKANKYAIENRIKFDGENVSKLIDEIVDTTKKVNSRPKDKVAAFAVKNTAADGERVSL